MGKMTKKAELEAMEEMAVHARAATDLLKALAHENRLMILCQLLSGEKSVRELEELCNMRQAGVSQHLARLRYDGLVDYRKDGTTMYYSVVSEEAGRVIDILYELYCKDITKGRSRKK